MELAIDTSTRFASVGLSRQGELAAELTWRSERNHSVELVPSIKTLLERAGSGVNRIEAIYIAAGPGGFSALRVGMSAAKAMAVSLGVPLVAVGTLDVEAQPYLGLRRPVCALIGAGRGRLYVGNFGGDTQPTYGVIEHGALGAAASADALFCGEGVAAAADLIRSEFGGGAAIAAVSPPTRRAGVMAAMGYEALRQGHTADVNSLEPIYLRSSQIAAANKARQAQQDADKER